jgi:hypothetical protein
MRNSINVHETHAWILTDAGGRMRAMSSGFDALLGAPRLRRGDDLASRFPSRRRALLFDMEVALTGWPAERTIVLETISRRPAAVRYRVCRWWLTDEIGLFWIWTGADHDERCRCA